MKKIVVTGGSGFIGTRFYQMYKDRFDIKALSSRDLDVTDEKAVRDYIISEKPDYVFHMAGKPNQQFCIDNPEIAYAVNVKGALYVAKACKEIGAKMLLTSTEQLYNGSKEEGPYNEDSTPVPNTVYGENKLEVEEKLPELLDEVWITRLSWIFGMPEKNCADGVNILMDTLKAVYKNQPIKASNYEFRGMTDVDEICENFIKILDKPYGTYDFASTNDYSRYEIVKHIMKETGLSDDRINELLIEDNSKFNEDNLRDLRLDSTKAKNMGMNFTDTKEAIHNVLKKFNLI